MIKIIETEDKISLYDMDNNKSTPYRIYDTRRHKIECNCWESYGNIRIKNKNHNYDVFIASLNNVVYYKDEVDSSKEFSY
jgi:hypothetical protein